MKNEQISECFHYNDEFYSDILHYAEQMDEEVETLPEDWSIKVTACSLQPMVLFTPEFIADMVDEERFSEDAPEYDKIVEALKKTVDFEKLNSLIPKLNYTTRQSYLITKADLLAAIA